MATEARSRKRPCSTTPGIAVECRGKRFRIRNTAEGCVKNMMAAIGDERLIRRSGGAPAAPERPSRAAAGFDRRAGWRPGRTARPRSEAERRRGCRPACRRRRRRSSAPRPRRRSSRAAAPAAALDQRQARSISSAPSTVRSSAGSSSSVVSGMPCRLRESRGLLRRRHADNVEARRAPARRGA